MNDNAKKWVEALRSGEYEQAKGALRSRRGGYCCLGVACEVYAQETGHGEFDEFGTFLDVEGVLPLDVANWVGLRALDGSYDGSSLVVDNDGRGLSFAEIADLIESEPEGLFV